jgi:hypothetical protein
MQIRGGRGYETADSLRARGDEPVPVERFMRDCRINTIFEGSSEIMRLFIAREMLDPHLKVSAAMFNTQLPKGDRLKAALRAGAFYAGWYPKQLLPFVSGLPGGLHPKLARHLRYAARTSKKLARRLFHAMAKYGPKLEREQILLGRFVDIGAEVFAITATCSRAHSLRASGSSEQNGDLLELADYFCHSTRLRIEKLFLGLRHNADRQGYRLAQQVLKSESKVLEEGIVRKTN